MCLPQILLCLVLVTKSFVNSCLIFYFIAVLLLNHSSVEYNRTLPPRSFTRLALKQNLFAIYILYFISTTALSLLFSSVTYTSMCLPQILLCLVLVTKSFVNSCLIFYSIAVLLLNRSSVEYNRTLPPRSFTRLALKQNLFAIYIYFLTLILSFCISDKILRDFLYPLITE
jgi:hypothetical protein